MRALLAAIIVGLLFTPSAVLAQIKKPPDPKDLIKDPKTPGSLDKKNMPEGPSENTPLGGKTLDEWIGEIFNKDPARSQMAIRMVTAYGPELAQKAVPTLNKLMRLHAQIDLSVRVNGIIVLGEILAEENNPEPKLVKEVVPVLVHILKEDNQVIVKYKAAEAIGNIGPSAVGAVPQLIATLNEKPSLSWEVRHACAQALGKVAYNEKTGPSVDVLNTLYNRLMKDSASQVRLAAIQAFTWLGPPTNPTHQKVVYEALDLVGKKDPEPSIRIWAHLAQMSIEGKPKITKIREISEFLKHKDVTVRTQAAQALYALGLDAKGEVSHLIEALEDEEPPVVGWAVMALSRMGGFAEPALGRLQVIAKNKEDYPPAVCDMAQKVVAELQGKTVGTEKEPSDE